VAVFDAKYHYTRITLVGAPSRRSATATMTGNERHRARRLVERPKSSTRPCTARVSVRALHRRCKRRERCCSRGRHCAQPTRARTTSSTPMCKVRAAGANLDAFVQEVSNDASTTACLPQLRQRWALRWGGRLARCRWRGTCGIDLSLSRYPLALCPDLNTCCVRLCGVAINSISDLGAVRCRYEPLRLSGASCRGDADVNIWEWWANDS